MVSKRANDESDCTEGRGQAKKAKNSGIEDADADGLCLRCSNLSLECFFDDSPLPDGDMWQELAVLGLPEHQDSRCAACKLLFQVPGCPDLKWTGPVKLYKVPWSAMNVTILNKSQRNLDATTRCIFFIARDVDYEGYVVPFSQVLATGTSEWLETFLNTTAFLSVQTTRTQPRMMRKIGHEVDFDLVQSWIRDCHDTHDRCGEDFTRGSTILMNVIDCQTSTVIPAPPKSSYAALSYVWGEQRTQQDEAIAIPNFYGPLPSGLPRLIEDAMTVAMALRIRYLWVDKYCIPQSDPVQKLRQIKQMDRIYSGAEVTFIALVDNPYSALPRIGHASKSRQGVLRLAGKCIVSTMPDPKGTILASRWNTRAWVRC